LSKRVLAAFLVTLFIVATFATVAEVQAHYTLGAQSSTGPYWDGIAWPDTGVDSPGSTVSGNHVPGSIAYVTPGLGYIPPSHQWENYYSPDAAIITDTTGGLTFYINVTDIEADWMTLWDITWEDDFWLTIAIPPEFTPLADWANGEVTGVSTTITNDYGLIRTGKFANDDDVAPNWWYIKISAATLPDHDGSLYGDQGVLYPPGIDPYMDRQLRTGAFAGCYVVSTGNLKAPSCAGKHFFKIFVDQDGTYVESIPFENYPVLLVKGELDPGYISGKILYCGSYYYGYYYGKPIWKPGRVVAEGEAIDPVTNEPTGRKVCAVGYFSADANGYYEIEGLAPGIYKLTAEAAGFPPVTLATEITVKRGQSIHGINIYVCPGAKIRLKVVSKCPTGATPWPEYAVNYEAWAMHPGDLTDVFPIAEPTWELRDEEGNVVVPTFNAGAWIIEVTDTYFVMYIGDPSSYEGTEILWDGHVPQFEADWISGLAAGAYYPKVNVFGYVQQLNIGGDVIDYPVVVPSSEYTGWIFREMDIFKGGKVAATVHFHNQEMPSAEEPPVESGDLLIEAYDADGNLWAWNETSVVGGPSGDTSVTLDVIGDEDVPYGMAAGTYTFKVYFIGYVQQEFPQHTIQLCTSNSFSFHLVKGGNVTVTVYSRDWENPAQSLDWLYPPAHLRVYFYNSKDELIGYKEANQIAGQDWVTVAYWGEEEEVGFGTDVYKIKAYTVGYVQKAIPEVWVQKASSTGDIPLYLYAGARIMCTVNFKIEQLFAPLPPSDWSYYFRLNVYDEEGNLAAANITSVPQATDIQPNGVQQWVFEVVGFGGSTTPDDMWYYGGSSFGSDWLTLPSQDYPGGWIPADRFGYWEPTSIEATEEGYHLDYGIPEGTYTVQLVDETNGYVQMATVAATVSWMGTAMLFFDMHKQASIGGTVYQRNYMGDFRLASWYTVEVSGSPAITTSTKDGDWSVSVPAGTYTVKVYLKAPDVTPAVVEQDRTVVVTWGADSSGQNFYLEEGGVPIPEFPAAGVLMLISALAASLYLLRWRKQAILPMP